MNRKKILLVIFVSFIIFWSLFPILWIFNHSLMFEEELYSRPPHWIPQNPIPNNYMQILGIPAYYPRYGEVKASGHAPAILNGIRNSTIVALLVMTATVIVATIVAYPLARFNLRHGNKYLFVVLTSRTIPAISIAIPYFIFFFYLGLYGTVFGVAILHFSITIPFMIWVLIGYLNTLPLDLDRSARVDGYGRLGVFRKVIVPMAGPAIVTSIVLTFLFSWNEFLFAWIFTSGTTAQTLPPAFPSMLFMLADPNNMAAAVIISLIPPIVICAFFERYITRLKIVGAVQIKSG